MTACNLRSLLVAAIVLSNCITWTASRRHYTQHMHRTRHRRQGAGLYLSGSYVIPGGEGAGWGEWGEVSPCSRTCGGGVASQKRICLQVGPDGRPQCRGGDTKYFSCQTQDCPPDAVDFRAEQCAAYDDKDFRGFKYKWIPYTKTPNPCELNCMPRGERFYYRHSAKVIDGTRCSEDSFDVCVDGVCQPVGCDMMLGSNAREDKCRECRGNGINCHTAGGLIDTQDLIKGYNDIMLIPASATTIIIEEIAPSNNYLALRSKNGTFYLNGLYHIDFPRSLMIAGALWNYERSQSGFAAPDKLKCLGPTLEPLYLSLLLQDENVGIQYEYSVPTKLAPITDRRYNWVHEEFTPCSASCGGGLQTRNVTCRSSEELDIVDEALCDEGLKPPVNQSCNNEACPPEWVEEPWSECSKRCGKDGVRKREVTCQKIISNGYPSLVANKECFDLHGPKPELFQECNRDAVCPQWFVGRWQACNKLCDEGTQKRQVVCYQKTNGRIEVLDDKECEDEKPATEQPCMLSVCAGLDWIATEWSGCDTCLSTVQTRQILCASIDHKVYNDSLCSYHNRPATEQPCDKSKLPPCEAQWYSTQWSNCSVECGDGVQVRKVFCGVYEDGTVREVADELCAAYPKYNDTKPCSVPLDECPNQWYAGPWQGCNVDCGGGEEVRQAMCITGNKPTRCPFATSPKTSRTCNLYPCNPDELITVTVPILDDVEHDDDLPFCDDEEDYPEVGLDLTTLYDTMSSDAGYNTTYETESSFFALSTNEGSGFGTESTQTNDSETGLTTLSIIDSTNSTLSVDFDYTDKFTTDATDYDTTNNSTTDNSTTDNSTTDISTTDNSTTDNSTTDNSTTDNSTTDISTTDNSTTDNGTTDNSTTDISTTDNSTTDKSTTDINTTDNSTADNSTTDNSTTDISTTDNSTTDNSTTDNIATDNSTTDNSTTDNSTTDTSTTDNSTTDNITTANSTTDNITTDNSTTDISTTNNSTTDKSTTDISTTDNSTTDNSTTDNSTTDNSTTDNSTTDISTTDNSTTDISTTDISTTDISTTDNSTTDNSTTDNITTDNSTTDNSTTDNSTTDISTTDNRTTDNSTTDNSTTDNITTDKSTTDKSTTDKSTTDNSTTDNSTTDISTTDISTSETGSSEKDLNETNATETANTTETDSSTLASVTSSEDKESTNSTTDKTDATESTVSSETTKTDINTSTETSVTNSDETTTSATISDLSTTDSASTDTTDKVSTIKDKSVTPRRPPEVEVTGTVSTVTDESASTSTDESGSTETSVSGAETENTMSTVSETNSTATESTETEDTTDSTSETVTPTTDLTSTNSSSESSSESTITSESSSTNITEESSSDSSATSTEPSSTGTTEESSSESSTPTAEPSSTGTTEATTDTEATKSTDIKTTSSTDTNTTASAFTTEDDDTTTSSVTTFKSKNATTTLPSDVTTRRATESSSEATTISAEPSSTGSTEESSSESSTPTAEPSSTGTTEATTDTEATKSTDIKTTSSTDTNTTASAFTTEDDDTTTSSVTTFKSKNATTTLPSDVTTRRATESSSEATTISAEPSSTGSTEESSSESSTPTAEPSSTGTTEATTDTEATKSTDIKTTSSTDTNTTASAFTTEDDDTTTSSVTTFKSKNATTTLPSDVTTRRATESSSEATTISAEPSSTGSTEESSSESSTPTAEPSSTGTTEDTEATNSTDIKTTSSTDTNTTALAFTTEDDDPTIAFVTISKSKNATTTLSPDVTTRRATDGTSAESSKTTTEPSVTTESSASTIGSSDSTIATSHASGSESITTAETASGSESTTESGTTTGSESSGTTESTLAESTTEIASSTKPATTVSGGSTESELTTTKASESTKETTLGSTTESIQSTTTGESEAASGVTTEGLSTTDSSATETTTPSLVKSSRIPFPTKPRMCKPRRKPKCEKTRFGCCPDRKTEAKDPFDKGCQKPRTCVETNFGCCPDGVSAAHGPHGEGCPVTLCEETLFGCCLSDNKTAAQGNDQDGCPPPPPACSLSTHGCCADNETEATGPNSEGCPESSTTTSMAAETTTAATESTEKTETSETTETYGTSSTIQGSSTSGGTSSIEASSVTASSTVMEECANSEFGCCHDNETSASGPDGQGCPCNATEFGCCSDGVSPAQGENQKGCQGLCKDSAHGCCPDNETPAHGPEFEGCCLLTAFGCCSDNRKPAEGPRLEGCKCQKYQHGCCPDNVTAALGPNNEGCGCQYTAFGCCPDRRTTASGPDYEGCGCHTYQFGCCPDGVTISIGPDQQGCHCRYSTYGCCGDEQTPATGPDGAGCDCAASKHGCCPDGQTPAEGTKFLGCTDVIEDKQAVCALPNDPGPCHNFTAMWFYDLTYGGCSRFWYGGCEGNGNKFATKEDCEDICVQPTPKDACKLPGVKGPCDADHVHWYYNITVEQCIPFRYGGCLGNANNFDTRELCQAQCEPEKSSDKCNLPIEKGPCAGNFSSWGYNIESQKCEQFIWGGCEGNGNRFKTESACHMRCNPTPTECTELQQPGNCSNKEALWSFSQDENRCVPFYYTGCDGNTNRFDTRESCEQVCPSAYEPDKCTLPAETGECSSYREKWFYDTAIKRCRQFYYGGCGGNENNFDTEAQCQNACSESVTTTTTTVRPIQPQQPEAQPQPQPQPEAEPNAFCFFKIDQGGRCASAGPEQRYGYDSSLGKCVTFQYLGCGGNQNNFPYEEHCKYYCHPVQDICQLPMLAGPCEESVMAWFYDPASDSCSQFTYGGCEGNDNRFESREACETRCRTGVTNDVTTRMTPLAVHTPITETRFGEVLPPNCTVSPTLEECTSAGEVWFFDVQQHECVSHMNSGSGAECRHTATFLTQEGCERNCGAFRGVDVCKQSVDPGPCREFVVKVYFDQDSGSCKHFEYGGCLGGANRFSNVEECAQTCLSSIDVCQLPVEQGDCYLNIRQWYYDASRGYCNQFVYTGCGGNDNRFETRQECEARCRRPTAPITTTTLASVVQPEPASACSTPSSLAPCGSNLTVFYYDSASKICVPSEFGNCGHPNSYRSEEECERKCGAFVGLNICQARLDTGPCRNPVPKYFYDSATGRCQRFAYSGCGGGPNRFSTIEECKEFCGNSGPAPGCLLEVDTGYAEGCLEPSVPRYHYSTSRADCMLFVYKGCGGNENNFPTYKQCQRTCIPSANNEVGCETYESECATLQCEYGLERTPAPGGCERCVCADSSAQCDLLRQECDALVCPYGVNRIQQDGCERCVCQEDPCSVANCSPDQRCVATAYTDPMTHEPKYSASCITDHVDQGNEVLPDCSYEEAACAQLRCEFGVQRVRTADGCQRCQCVAVEIDCEPLRKDCEQLSCPYGLNRTKGPDGCERCTCKDPCLGKSCPDGERCVVNAYRHIMDEMRYSTECRAVTKEGQCPLDETTSNEVMCRHECNDDADCRGVGKCCRRGCSDLCLVPATPGPPMRNIHTTTYAPDILAAPQALPQPEPEVSASEGGKATLRCLFHSNPPPRITWTFGAVTIDGNMGRYRLMSDGALEIVSLYRNDTGVYICVADNELGRATQQINLVVNDPVRAPVGIAGDENAVVTGELDRPLSISCLAFGYPPPGIYWEHNGAMVAFNDAIYEIRGNTLLIRSLSVDTLGQYTCQAYNGVGKAASWVVSVRAYRPEGIFLEHEYVVPRHYIRTTSRAPPPSTREVTTTTSTTTTTTERPIFFTVPVSTHVSTAYSTMRTGAELRLVCEVDGYPEPDVYWTKDSARITPNERISISGSAAVSRLVISKVAVSDSGLYGCHADNRYTSHSDNAQINVQQLTVPAKCTDNPFFANCDLIVRSKFCIHKYYSKFCCKSCVEAGQLDPQVAEMQADQPYRKK